MALHDILSAITTEADRHIATLKAQHEQTVSDALTGAKRELEKFESSLTAEYGRKQDQAVRNAKLRAGQVLRNAVLQRKHEHLDSVYAAVLDRLAANAGAFGPLFTSVLARFSGGVIRPSAPHAALLRQLVGGNTALAMGSEIDASGGFVWATDTRQEDWRLESIVNDLLRPRTELDISLALFPQTHA